MIFFPSGWDVQPVLPFKHYKWLGYIINLTISTSQMAGMHSESYHIYQHYKWLGYTASLTILALQTARMHGQYCDINITNGWDAQPVLPYNITSGCDVQPALPYKS